MPSLLGFLVVAESINSSVADQIMNGLTSGVLAIGPRDEILAANLADA